MSIVVRMCAAVLLSVWLGFGAPAHAQPEPLPGSFVVAGAELALGGDPEGVMLFVAWRETPQGEEYWAAEYQRMNAGGKMSAEARQIVSGWIAEAGRLEQSPVPETFVLSAARRALLNDPDALLGFVTWSDTPQGHDYWAIQYQAVQEGYQIYPLAQRIIQHWIAQAEGG